MKAALAGGTALSPERTLRLFEQIGDALDAAHQTGLVHRDVKPGNVLLTSVHEHGDHVYLTDFGLTKRAAALTGGLTGTGHFLGTIDYVAPEQISSKPVDARTDIYALGCVLFECLTGQVPFRREEDASTLWAHLVDRPPPITAVRTDLTDALDAVVARAMAKSPDDRYSSCHALVQDLRAAFALAAPVSGARNLRGVDTSPAIGTGDLERDRRTSVPADHPSFPPGSFPPGPRPQGSRPPSHRAEEPEFDDAYETSDGDDRYADTERPQPGSSGAGVVPGYVGDSDAQGQDGAAADRPLRTFVHRRRWPLAAALAAVIALAAAILVLPSSAARELGSHAGAAERQQSGAGNRSVDPRPGKCPRPLVLAEAAGRRAGSIAGHRVFRRRLLGSHGRRDGRGRDERPL
jgi:serine/threonine protein kinase